MYVPLKKIVLRKKYIKAHLLFGWLVWQTSTKHHKLKRVDRAFALTCVNLQALTTNPVVCRFLMSKSKKYVVVRLNVHRISRGKRVYFVFQVLNI